MSRSPEVEQRALALVEQLLDSPLDDQAEAALLAHEPKAVQDRVTALKAAMQDSEIVLPTQFPGGLITSDLSPPPEQVGAFRLVRRIGMGGMGGVWLAERNDGLYDQKVAVKFIRPGLVNLAGAAFRAERQILARLEHPNIARLIDGGITPDHTPYLVMEYVDGVPIDEAAEPLALKERVRIFVMAADAVQFAHSRLVVHADLKPSNIFVDRQGRVKLLDFGIARLIEDDADTTGLVLPMTRDFASPQRLAGHTPTTGDDLFALGCILAELTRTADPDLKAIAEKARAPEEADRYGSVAALIADLDRWSDQLPVAARPATLRYRADKFIARHRMGVIATCVALAMLGGLAGIATRNALMADRANQEAQARFVDARGAAKLVSDELLAQLASRPGTFAVRSRTVQAAQFYLDRLAASPKAPADLRLEAAQGLQRVAEAQGKPGVPNLGLTQAAYDNLGKALRLVDGLVGEQARLLTIRILLDRARLNSFARNDVQAALADLARADKLLGPAKGSPDFLRAQYFIELSVAQQWNSDYSEAIRSARTALSYIPRDAIRDHVIAHSTALDLYAEAIYYSISEKQSLPPYRDALAVLLAYEKTHPGDQIMNRRIARAQWALGSSIAGFGDPREAVAVLTESSRRTKEILAADPDDEDARRMVRISENARGQALAQAGEVDTGIAIIRANIAERKTHLDRRPDDPMRMRDYMVAIKGLGDLQIQYGRRAEACATYEQARQLIAVIRARGKLTALDLMSASKQVEEVRAKQCTAAMATI
jgi:tetratricopeptide (TPR) repeat protein